MISDLESLCSLAGVEDEQWKGEAQMIQAGFDFISFLFWIF
jgi:hypothetical protein